MSETDLISWLALSRVPHVGVTLFGKLVEHFGHPSKVFKAKETELVESGCLTRPALASLKSFRDFKGAEEELELLTKNGVEVIPFTDNRYPSRLKQTAAYPPLLFAQGRVEILNEGEWLGVVGSRKATEYGLVACRRLVGELVDAGIRIASGFALGIDITAHLACVEKKGLTAAVFGSGLGFIHPPSHRRHVSRILEQGVLLSEFPYGMPSTPGMFPRRNRLISGLSRGVLVVEADEKSGALITAQYAAEQNRDLFAVPGPIGSFRSTGCNRLIQQGAKLVSRADDILLEWDYARQRKLPDQAPADGEEKSVYETCRDTVRSSDEIVDLTGLHPRQVFHLLTKLELDGKIKSLPGKRYQSL